VEALIAQSGDVRTVRCVSTSNNPLPNAEHLPAEVVSAIVKYQPSELDPLLVAALLDPIRNLVAQVPPRSVDDARQMLAAATRFVRETAPGVASSVVEVFSQAAITRWEHASLTAGGSVDRVRLYASWLHRLRRVAIGCSGRAPRGADQVSTAAVYSYAELSLIVDELPAECRGAFVAFVGAGIRPSAFGAGRFERVDNTMFAVTGDSVRYRVVQAVSDLIDVGWRRQRCSWAELRCAADSAGFDLDFQRCADSFVARVAQTEPACDALLVFGLGRQRLERVVAGIAPVSPDALRLLRASGLGAVEVTMDGLIRNSRKGANMPRPSRKAVRELAAQYASGGACELNETEQRRLENYRPQDTDPDAWAAVQETHRAAMQRCGSLTQSGFDQTMSIVSSLLVWRHSRGLNTELVESFTSNSIDLFCEHGLDGREVSTRSTYRTRLTPIAVAVDPDAIARPIYTTGGHQPLRPCYTANEERSIRRAVNSHPGGVTGRKLAAVVGLAAGAGLDTMDMRYLQRNNICIGDNGITIEVSGSRPRQTVVRKIYEDMLIAGLEGLSPKQLVFGTKKNRRNVLGNVFANAVVFDDTPNIEVSRLRATWLAAHMQAAVPIQMILNAAGLKSARALVDLLPYLPDTDGDTAAVVLRGVA